MRNIIAAVTLFFVCQAIYADATLQFQVRDLAAPSAPVRTQTLYVKNQRILIKAAGGDNRVDILFDETGQTMSIVDHAKRTYLPLNEQNVTELADRAEGLVSAVQEQVATLPPEQRAQLEQLLGNSMLGSVTKGENPAPEPKTYVKTGLRQVHTIKCQGIEVLKANAKIAELCVAHAAAIGIPDADFKTIKAFQVFGERLAARASKLAERFGARVPEFGTHKLDGLPVQLKDHSATGNMVMTVARVATETIADRAMQIPKDYTADRLPAF